MNNKTKAWESQKKLLEKLKKERADCIKMHNNYISGMKEERVKGITEDGKLTIIASRKPSESPWSRFIKEYNTRISNFQNSNCFRYCKKIAKGRKGGI